MRTALRFSSTISQVKLFGRRTAFHSFHHCQSNRLFVTSFLESTLGPCPLRKLSRTKTLPYTSQAIFNAVSDVSGYPTFLPFTISSQVTSQDDQGYPTRAKLIVGYANFGLEEEWNSIVHCDPKNGTVVARSSGLNSHGLFETLEARWKIGALQSSHPETTVKLDVDVRFRNLVYDQMFSKVEDKVADRMISAFEKRVQQLDTSQRDQQRQEKP